MNETLRPSTLGEILDRTFQLYRNNFWRFVGIAALPLVAALVLAIPIGLIFAASIFAIPGVAHGGAADLTTAVRGIVFIGIFAVFLPLYLAVYAYSIAGITGATVGAQRGEKLTVRAALKSVWPRFWTYFWYFVLQMIVAGIAPLCVAGVLIGPPIYLINRAGTGIGAGIALGFLVFVLGAATIGVVAWLALSFAMGMAVCMVEEKPAWESLKRSWSLSQGTRGRIFVLYLLVVALSFVVVMVSYFLGGIVVVAASFLGSNSTAAVIVTIAGAIVYFAVNISSQIALVPVPWIALVLFYYDQRIRKEGYDIEWMMQQAGLAPAQPQDAAAETGPAGFPPVRPPDTLGER
jgi:hypothetical protein